MSYILDALRKSEQQRQRGATPSLIAAQTTDAAPRQPAVLGYSLFAAALLAAGIVIGTMRPWQSEGPAPQPLAPRPPEAVAPLPVPPAAPEPVAVATKVERPAPIPAPPTQPAPAPPIDVPRAQAPVPAASTQSVPSAMATTPATDAVPSRESEKPAGARAAPTVTERTPVAFADLPPAVQQEVPKLSILFHLYSANARDRLVGINNLILHEGDSVQPGLVLEQISADGMILNYKGYRFMQGPR